MESEIIGSLLDFGMGGIFIAFMIWQWIASQKKSEQQVDRFMNSLTEIRKEHQDKEQSLRDRYDVVINTYNEERTVIRSNIAGRVEKIINHVKEIGEEVDRLLIESTASAEASRDMHGELEKMKYNLSKLVAKMEEMDKNVTSGLTLMQSLQQEAKLREAARQAIAQSRKDLDE